MTSRGFLAIYPENALMASVQRRVSSPARRRWSVATAPAPAGAARTMAGRSRRP